MSAGAQTIRDVIIRIGLQASSSGFSAPDFKKIEREANDAAAALGKLNAEMRGGKGGGPGGAGVSAQRAPDMFAGMDIGVNKYKDQITRQRRFNEQILASDNLVLKRSDTANRLAESATRANEKLMQSEKEALEISTQRAEVYGQVANAALKLARGVAFVSAANESEYQSMLKTIAQTQGYFDIFTGILDGYKAYTNLTKLSTVAKIAEARATDVQTAAEIRLAAAKSASGGGGRVGIAIAAVAAGGYGAYKFGQGLYGESEMGARRRFDAERRDRALAFGSEEARAQRNATGTDAISSMFDAIGGRVDAGRNIRASMMSGPRAITAEMALAGLDRDQRASTQILRGGQLVGSVDQTNLEKAQREQKALELTLQFEQERQSILEKEQQSLERQLQTALGIKQAAIETWRAEEQRYQTLESRLGRMSAGEANRLKSIGDKLQKGGQLSRSEAEFLDRTGIGTAQSEAYFRAEGQRRGSSGILSAFNEDRGLNTARDNLRTATLTADAAAEETTQKLSEVATSLRQTFEDQTKLFVDILTATESVRAEQAKMEQRLSNVERAPLSNPFK